MIGTIKALNDTWLKTSPEAASSLPEASKIFCPKGTEIELRWIDDDVEAGHRKIDLAQSQKGKFSWYTFIEHWQADEVEHPKLNEFEVPEFTGSRVQLPGLGLRFLDQPVDGCKNFSWNEMLHGGTRIPNSTDIAPGLTPGMVIQNIIKITKRLEEIREDFGGRPVTINSGYRPPSVNRAIGGASQSRHLWGDAVDFNIRGVHPREIYQRYDATWIGGLAWSNGFVHIDARPGYKSRWRYPN
jgi:hypothetical protein